MSINLVRILFDFGLLVLIWLVQLVIYPSFQYYSHEKLIAWHKIYTVGISLVVIPLMFGQLISAGIQLMAKPSFFTIGGCILIILVWISTFTQFVPIHQTISSGLADDQLLGQLVSKNWIRTGLWSLIFVLSISQNYK